MIILSYCQGILLNRGEMNYRSRIQEAFVRQLADYFKIVFLVGARQVGKSTLLTHLFPEFPVVVFDPVWAVYLKPFALI